MVEYNECRVDDEFRALRPELFLEAKVQKTEIENFQNETLRPILKLQHNQLIDFILVQPNIEAVLKYKDKRTVFTERMRIYLQQPLLKGIVLGIVLGCLTSEELKMFNANAKEYKRRIHAMALQRFTDSL